MKETSSEKRTFSASQQELGNVLPPVKQAMLVVEHGEVPPTNLPNIVTALSRFLNPEQVELTLVHAEFDWVNLPAEPMGGSYNDGSYNMGALLAARETGLQHERHMILKTLNDCGFTVAHEQETSTRGKNTQALLTSLEDAETDLLIVISQPDPAERSQASQFVRTLVTQATIPVLLIRQPVSQGEQPLRVLLGVDSSEASMNAARQLKSILPDCRMQLELVTVQSPIYQENAVLAPYVNQEVLDEALNANAKMVFEIVSDILGNLNVPVSDCKKLIGSPATELGHLAEVEHPDLLVVGSHNRKGMLAWLLGSVSSQLLHWDAHNMLVVR